MSHLTTHPSTFYCTKHQNPKSAVLSHFLNPRQGNIPKRKEIARERHKMCQKSGIVIHTSFCKNKKTAEKTISDRFFEKYRPKSYQSTPKRFPEPFSAVSSSVSSVLPALSALSSSKRQWYNPANASPPFFAAAYMLEYLNPVASIAAFMSSYVATTSYFLSSCIIRPSVDFLLFVLFSFFLSAASNALCGGLHPFSSHSSVQ